MHMAASLIVHGDAHGSWVCVPPLRHLDLRVILCRRIAGAMSVQYESEVQRHQEELQAAAKQLVAMAGPVFGQDGLC